MEVPFSLYERWSKDIAGLSIREQLNGLIDMDLVPVWRLERHDVPCCLVLVDRRFVLEKACIIV